jgi:valyl-tRNA synthetase
VYIHALVRDAEGQKMSKSRGNVIDPLEVLEKYGTDSFRFTLAAFAAQGRDIRLSEERIAGYRNFTNKIWNASRFALGNLQGFDPGSPPGEGILSLADRWILSRLNRTIAELRRGLDSYKFNEAASALYQFLWHEFCDWYVELIKPDLYQEKDPGRRWTAQSVLARVMDASLRLLHPFMPFITEEIWQNLPGNAGSIMVAEFPRVKESEIHPQAEFRMDLIREVVGAIRNLRSEMDVGPAKRVEVILYSPKEEVLNLLQENRGYVEGLARVERMTFQSRGEKPKRSAMAVVGEVEVFLPLKGLIDLEDEEKRLQKEFTKVAVELNRTNQKLQNQEFLKRARPEAVSKEREKARALTEREAKLKEALERVRAWKEEG